MKGIEKERGEGKGDLEGEWMWERKRENEISIEGMRAKGNNREVTETKRQTERVTNTDEDRNETNKGRKKTNIKKK